MNLQKVIAITKSLEDPKRPLLGPILKGLYFFGLWKTGTRFRSIAYNFVHAATLVFVFLQLIDVYIVRHDINRVLNNVSLTVLSVICFAKCYSLVMWQSDWRQLAHQISEEEVLQLKKQDPVITKNINDYIKYTRIITLLFWFLVFGTNLLLIVTPPLKYLSSHSYREQIKSGEEPLPQIIYAWFPFDIYKMPGYVFGITFQIIMSSQGSGVIATYDMNAVAIMNYFKGQLIIMQHKSNCIFKEATSVEKVLANIQECHRHHNSLVKHYKMFNSLLSPTMFLYVLLCSMTICGSIVQFSLTNITTSQKLFVIQYTLGLVLQLFMYCWHGTEVTVQSFKADDGVYSCDWWKGDPRIRKQLLLLAGKFNFPFIFSAGPYATLCLPVFIDIMKGSYSFYTLFSQMQEN